MMRPRKLFVCLLAGASLALNAGCIITTPSAVKLGAAQPSPEEEILRRREKVQSVKDDQERAIECAEYQRAFDKSLEHEADVLNAVSAFYYDEVTVIRRSSERTGPNNVDELRLYCTFVVEMKGPVQMKRLEEMISAALEQANVKPLHPPSLWWITDVNDKVFGGEIALESR